MSKAGKLVKGMVKAKKESVMGKLGDAPYEDPMEPWSAKYGQPVKEGVEQLDESDPLLFKYIRSLGYNPEQMDFATRSKYARSNNFKNYKIGHMNDQFRNEEVEELDEAGTGLLMSYIKAKGLNPLTMDGNQKQAYSRSSEFRLFKNRHVKETSGMGERGDDWNEENKPAKFKGNPAREGQVAAGGGTPAEKSALAAKYKKKPVKENSDICKTCENDPCICDDSHGFVNEAADAKDTVSFDIPLLIRVLEFTREDMKTDIELHNMVERLIDMRHDVPLTMEHYDAITGKLKESVSYQPATGRGSTTSAGHTIVGHSFHSNGTKHANIVKHGVTGKYFAAGGSSSHPTKNTTFHDSPEEAAKSKKSYVKEDQIDELSNTTLNSYVDKVATGPSRGMTQKGTLKSIKAIGGVTTALRKKAEKPLSELKKQDDNMELDDRITREEKKMKGADPCWTGYQMVGMKKKGGRSVPNCVPEQVAEGIGGIEDSPMSATNSVKAMESEQRKKNMKSARIIKSIYKKKGKNESMYDWEKDDKGEKPNAKITLQGGTTMTGKPRDTVEIEPVLKTRPNSQKQ